VRLAVRIGGKSKSASLKNEVFWIRLGARKKLIQSERYSRMNAMRLRSWMATGLSLWLGFLACVLGCAQPVLGSETSSHTRVFALNPAANEGGNGEMGDAGPCCHHGRGASSKKKPVAQTVSCCLLDAALMQKQDPVSRLRGHWPVAVLLLSVFQPSFPLSASHREDAPTVWHAGRDVLLQTHILRI
jgi:hypothetical protein